MTQPNQPDKQKLYDHTTKPEVVTQAAIEGAKDQDNQPDNKITRYDYIANGDRGMFPHPDGEYVKFSDHQTLVTQAKAEEREKAGKIIWLILPLAKGYVARNNVGSNRRYIEIAENYIDSLQALQDNQPLP